MPARFFGNVAIILFAISSCFLLLPGLDHARAVPVVVDPNTGLDSQSIDQRFLWSGGLGPIQSITAPGCSISCTIAFDPIWEITVAQDSLIDLSANDAFTVGDEFELVFDGSVIAWTNTFAGGGGFFVGQLSSLFLAMGTHTFSINVVSLAPGFTSGGAYLNFSPVSPVPVPAALPLFSSALAGLGLMGWRRRRKRLA